MSTYGTIKSGINSLCIHFSGLYRQMITLVVTQVHINNLVNHY